jgi:exopolysaccharide biosynthesis polyprenyl glycosylphosphotransferase
LESWPREVKAQMSAPAISAAPAPAHAPFAPTYVPVAAPDLDRETPIRVRLGLQQRAAINLQRHMLRALRRFGVLVVADLTSFYVMRELVRTVRDRAWLGQAIAVPLQSTLPQGILNGWQYAAALFVALFVTGNYGRGDQRRDPRRLFTACALATALPLWMTLWTRGLEPVIVQYAITTLLMWAGLVAERQVIDRIVGRVLPYPQQAAPTLFVGPAEECRRVIEHAAFTKGGEYWGVGFVDANFPPAADARGHIADFPGLLQESHAEAVVVCGYLPDARFGEVVDAALASECQMLSVPRAIDVAGVQPNLVWRRNQPLIELTAPTLKGWQLVLKRAVDLIGASLGLLIASPVMIVAAVGIKLDSEGPVLFRQERIGTGGRRFQVWKFRTMRHGVSDAAHRKLVHKLLAGRDAEAAHVTGRHGPVYKLVNDDRVTRFGRLLRRTSLDELPQLFNVLRGEMSLVGPRPPLAYEFDEYEHWQFDRLRVLPGITGLWQVSGRNRLTYRQMCELDVEYVRRWSVWLDLKILLKTVPVVLFNSGRAA